MSVITKNLCIKYLEIRGNLRSNWYGTMIRRLINSSSGKGSNSTDIEELHALACAAGKSSYRDPATGYTVFTAEFHKKRGKCCGSGCRHCPFDHVNVPEDRKNQYKTN